MPSFRWSAITPNGDVVHGVSEAADRAAMVDLLQSRGHIVVRAGEAGGTLSANLEQLALLLERERSLNASLRAALIYPVVLVVAAVGSMILLLDFVLPQFLPIFEQAGAQLPASTRALMIVGELVGAAAPWLLIAVIVMVLAARRALTVPALRVKADRLLLRLPLFGRLLRETL